jgi:hypothetical protein
MERLKSKMVKCEFCGKDVFARGLKSHVRLLHSLKYKSIDKKTDTGATLEVVMKELIKVEKILTNITEQIARSNLKLKEKNEDVDHMTRRLTKVKAKAKHDLREEQLSLF